MIIHFYTLGSLRQDLRFLEESYLKRLHIIQLKVTEVKKEKDFEALITQKTYLLKEQGTLFSTEQFKEFFLKEKKIEIALSDYYGFSEKVLKKTTRSISLSPLTLPHDLARIIFIEQVYRMETLFINHPYHY